MIYFQSLTQEELAQLLLPISQVTTRSGEMNEELEKKSLKRARYRAKQIFHWVYQRYVVEWDQMSDLSKDLRSWLKEHIEIHRLKETVSRQGLDGTHKFLWGLPDGKTIESVIIPAALQEKKNAFGNLTGPQGAEELDEDGSGEVGANPRGDIEAMKGYRSVSSPTKSAFAGRKARDSDLGSSQWARLTACISSQVGCAMACKFCLTGVQGLDRHLQTHEIVTQVHELRMRAPITNIVFMGMGEPLHNLDNVAKACQILLDQDGMNFSKRKVTISTSGLVPAIEELGRRVDVSLAISLNASNDEQRSQIMPVNRKWNIETLMNACRNYPLGSHRRITFEYVMLKDFNDTLEDAARVARLVRGIPSKVNLIPFNEHPGSEFKRPLDENVKVFQKFLLDRNITTTVRISRGRDISAACGQLRSLFGSARGTEKHRDRVESQATPQI